MLIFGFVNRLVGKPQLYLYATVACMMMNIILDFLTIKLLKMGVTGAAFATGLSYLIGFLIVMKPSLSRQTTVNIFSGKYRSKLFIKTIQNGSSEGIASISAALTMFLFNLAFIQYAGENGVAGLLCVGVLVFGSGKRSTHSLISRNLQNFILANPMPWLSPISLSETGNSHDFSKINFPLKLFSTSRKNIFRF